MHAYNKHKQRLKRIHDLINGKATGTPCQFADRLKVDVSTLYRDLKN